MTSTVASGSSSGGRVVVAGGRHRRAGRPGLGGRVPDLGRQHAGGDVLLLVAVRRAADREHLPVGQHGEGVVGAGVGHRRGLAPRGRRRGHVEHGRRRPRRSADDVGRAAGVEDLARPVHDRRAVLQAARSHRRPRLGGDVEGVGDVLFGPHGEDLAVRQQVGERVLLLVDLRRRHAGEQRPLVGGRVVDLGRLGPVRSVGGVAADHDVAAVGQLGHRRVPARLVHVRRPGPHVGGGVEDVGVDDADVAGGETAVAAGDEQAAVGKGRAGVAEHAARCVDRGVGGRGGRVPHHATAAGPASRPRTRACRCR